ncbi:hypothetical protein L1049_000383 [Liquidambar formosana]|uniref:Phytocyanin domain-containing protein n=1 Tax=Liquidambar formosana TaxID=63359 RepID=A0AAP0NAX7_LIQFO
MAAVSVSSFQFQVGGERGWIEPTGNETETYNKWATKNRFHVGDSVYFKYQKDSVLVVNYTDYTNCIVSNPISKYEDGNTIFRFDRHGFFYFISGEPGHCKSGQKLVIGVMAQSGDETPESVPSPAPSGGAGGGGPGDDDGWDFGDWGPPSLNSTVMLSVTSYFMTVLAVVVVILYMFM